MNIRIFWVRAMECMCTQIRPRFILSPKKVLGKWSQNQCKLQGKNPLYRENPPPPPPPPTEENRTHDAASSRTASPTPYPTPIPAHVWLYGTCGSAHVLPASLCPAIGILPLLWHVAAAALHCVTRIWQACQGERSRLLHICVTVHVFPTSVLAWGFVFHLHHVAVQYCSPRCEKPKRVRVDSSLPNLWDRARVSSLAVSLAVRVLPLHRVVVVVVQWCSLCCDGSVL